MTEEIFRKRVKKLKTTSMKKNIQIQNGLITLTCKEFRSIIKIIKEYRFYHRPSPGSCFIRKFFFLRHLVNKLVLCHGF